jgi:hypothetical protein
MCHDFERWNWKSRAKQRDQKVVPSQSTQPKREEPSPVQVKEPAREEKVTEKIPA